MLNKGDEGEIIIFVWKTRAYEILPSVFGLIDLLFRYSLGPPVKSGGAAALRTA
jgi:hypothetical protein